MKKWFKHLKNGRESVESEPHSRRPCTSRNKEEKNEIAKFFDSCGFVYHEYAPEGQRVLSGGFTLTSFLNQFALILLPKNAYFLSVSANLPPSQLPSHLLLIQPLVFFYKILHGFNITIFCSFPMPFSLPNPNLYSPFPILSQSHSPFPMPFSLLSQCSLRENS